jgi:hypothetical protein
VSADGHEVMFATNVMGSFLFTNLLLERLERSNGLVLHVVAPLTRRSTGRIWRALRSTGR